MRDGVEVFGVREPIFGEEIWRRRFLTSFSEVGRRKLRPRVIRFFPFFFGFGGSKSEGFGYVDARCLAEEVVEEMGFNEGERSEEMDEVLKEENMLNSYCMQYVSTRQKNGTEILFPSSNILRLVPEKPPEANLPSLDTLQLNQFKLSTKPRLSQVTEPTLTNEIANVTNPHSSHRGPSLHSRDDRDKSICGGKPSIWNISLDWVGNTK